MWDASIVLLMEWENRIFWNCVLVMWDFVQELGFVCVNKVKFRAYLYRSFWVSVSSVCSRTCGSLHTQDKHGSGSTMRLCVQVQPAHTGRRFLSLSGDTMTDRNVLFFTIYGGLWVTPVCQTAEEMDVLLFLPVAHTQTWTVTPLHAHPGWERVTVLPFLTLGRSSPCGFGQQLEVKAGSCLDVDFLWIETSSCLTPKGILPPLECFKYGTRLVNKTDLHLQKLTFPWSTNLVLFFMGKASLQSWTLWQICFRSRAQAIILQKTTLLLCCENKTWLRTSWRQLLTLSVTEQSISCHLDLQNLPNTRTKGPMWSVGQCLL